MRRSVTLCAAGLEHMNETGVLHLHDGLEVFRNELPLHHLDDGLLRGLVQAVNDPLDFFVNSGLHLVDVDTGAVLCQELLALHLKGPTCLVFVWRKKKHSEDFEPTAVLPERILLTYLGKGLQNPPRTQTGCPGQGPSAFGRHF